MDSTPSKKTYSHEELSSLINAALLRDDTPGPVKIANKIYNDIMMGEGAFARIARMLETEAMRLISRDLPLSLLGSSSAQANYIDIQDFYTALCENTRSDCGEISASFSRDILKNLAEWPRLQAIIESNVTLYERCREIADQSAGKPKCRVFSDPDRSNPMDLVNI